MKKIGYVLHGILFISFLTMRVTFAQTDIEGSKDHPLITRMPDYYISDYNVSEFGAYDPVIIDGSDVHWEGKVYSFNYERKEAARPISMLQIVRNYEAAIKRAGGKLLGTGDGRRMAAEIRKNGSLDRGLCRSIQRSKEL